MRKRLIAITAAAVLCMVTLFAQQNATNGGDLRVFSSNGIRTVLEEVLPQAKKAVGRPIVVEFGTSASLKRRMDAGEAFDLAIISSETLDSAIQSGKVDARTRTDLARSGIGVGIRAGAPKPDIRTPDSLKQTFLKARSITYAQSGASRIHIEKMMERFGIVEEMRAKTKLEQDSALGRAAVAEGRVDLIMTLVSEIVESSGVELVGPLPAEVQSYVVMTAGIGAQARDREGAQALIRFLSGSSLEPILKSKGMERR